MGLKSPGRILFDSKKVGLLEKIKVLCYFVLLSMILTRLVWIQVRNYSSLPTQESLAIAANPQTQHCIKADWHEELKTHRPVSWLYMSYVKLLCNKDISMVSRMNQYWYMATTFVSAFLIRFLTGSWLLSVFCATMLLSRGSPLRELGSYSINPLMEFGLMLWFTCLAHFVKSGALLVMVMATGLMLIYSFLDHLVLCTLFSLPLTILLGVWVHAPLKTVFLQQYRQKTISTFKSFIPRKMSFFSKILFFVTEVFVPKEAEMMVHSFKPRHNGGLFSALPTPFSVWIYHNNRFLNLTFYLIIAMVLAVLTQVVLVDGHFVPVASPQLIAVPSKWDHFVAVNLSSFDFHYLVSFLFIALNLFHTSEAGLPGFFEMCWIITMALFSCLTMGSIITLYGNQSSVITTYFYSNMEVMKWFEPIVLVLGLAGLYNLTHMFSRNTNY